MRAGSFNINSYLDKLYENAEDGNLTNKEGLILPDENKKTYDWLKKEYQAGQTEVKVEISGEGSSFKPGYDLQAAPDSAAEFKPGMFGEVKTKDGMPGKPGAPGDTKGGTPAAGDKPAEFGKPAGPSAGKPAAPAAGEKSADGKAPLDSKQGNPNFGKGEGNKPAAPKTDGDKGNIKNNNFGKKPEGEEKEEGEEDEKKPVSAPGAKKPEVKKIDLKTKK